MSNFVCWWLFFLYWVSIVFFPSAKKHIKRGRRLKILVRSVFFRLERGGGIKTSYHRHIGVSVGWVTSFVGEYFFFLGWVFFFFGLRPKKISATKKNITKNEVIIQRKHHYPYNIVHPVYWRYYSKLTILFLNLTKT